MEPEIPLYHALETATGHKPRQRFGKRDGLERRHPRDQQGADPLIPDRVLERSQVVPVDVEEAFAFFADARNLETITPPWLRFRILEAPQTLERGSLLVYRLRLFGVPIRWRTEIVEWRPPFGFTDVQLTGPYRRWEHTHRLRPVDGGTEICDQVVYRLPYEPLAGMVAPVTVRPWLTAIFDYRARQTEASLR
jgi:ligand-binding SRPBCC domain-containing protein